jgi:hypothetical protein
MGKYVKNRCSEVFEVELWLACEIYKIIEINLIIFYIQNRSFSLGYDDFILLYPCLAVVSRHIAFCNERLQSRDMK